ncbi:MAG: DEAD/DEAH box helicase [Pyrobaculum sp.]
MPKFSVVVNGVEISREWEWDKILKVKEELKKLGFRWDGASWRGRVLDLAIFARLKYLLDLTYEEYVSLLATLSRDSSTGVVVVVGRLPEELKKGVLASEGETHVLSLSGLLRGLVAKSKDVAKYRSYEEFVEVCVQDLRRLLQGLQIWGDLETALSNAKEFVLASKKTRELFERRKMWRAAAVGPNYARLNFLASGLLQRLAEFKMRYNVVTKDGELEGRDLRLVNVEKEGGGYVLKFPVFLRRAVIDVLEEFGYGVEEVEVKYPEVKYKKDFSLFPFQREAVDNWAAHGMRGTVVIPTGGGKTFVGLEAIYRAGVSALVLVVTKELAAQWAERIKKHLGVSPGMLGGGYRDVREITVAIYNSAVKYVDQLMGKFGLVIFDEAHHVPAETFKEVALALDSPFRLALSATPEREDENEHLIYEAVGPLVYRASYRAMIEAGLVVPVEHYRIYVRLTDEEAAAYRAMPSDNVILLRNAAAKSSKKFDIVVKIVKREVEQGSKVLVFTQFVDQAEELYRRIREAGVPAVLITSQEGDREVALRKFSEGKVRVVVATTVLDEGVDVPDADVAVVASGTGSKRQMIQRVGRVVRASPGKKKAKVYEIVTRGTVEEALSESRHFDEFIEELVCRKITESDIDKLFKTSLTLYMGE